MISSEMPEILGMSDRIAVMSQGYLTGELPVAEATQEKNNGECDERIRAMTNTKTNKNGVWLRFTAGLVSLSY